MQFFKLKKDNFERTDLSRKGSIDSRIVELVKFINQKECYFTTSSCSGRTILFTNSETKKKGCNWILVSHDVVSVDEIMKALDNHSGSAILKFEPFVLHTQCLSVEDAQKLHHCGIESGFKNSGISIGRTGKIIVAIRSTLSLEVPLSCNGALLVSKEYISFVVNTCNDKMQNNWQRIERFYTRLQNTNSKGNSLSKKIQKVKPHESILKDCDKDFMSEDVLLDTYYEGFHSLLNDTDG